MLAVPGTNDHAERLAKEAEEERLRQEELLRLEEERKYREAEERRLREEEATRRTAEIERLAGDLPKVLAADNSHEDAVKGERQARLEAEDWSAVLNTAELPSPASEAEIHTFLSEVAEVEAEQAASSGASDPKAVVEAMLSRIARAEVVARWLEDDAAVAGDEANIARADRSIAFSQLLRDDNTRRLDEVTAVMLQGREGFTRVVKDQEELSGHVSTGQGVAMALWCNLAGRKAMRAGKMEVPALGLRIAVSRAVSTHATDNLPTVLRVIRTPWDRVEASTARAVAFAAKHGLSEPPCTGATGGKGEGVRAPSARHRPPTAPADGAEGPGSQRAAATSGDSAEESKEADDEAVEDDAGADDAGSGSHNHASAGDTAEGDEGAAGASIRGGGDAAAATAADDNVAAMGGDSKRQGAGDDDDGTVADAAEAGPTSPAGMGSDGLHTVQSSRPAPRQRTASKELLDLDEPVSEVVSVELLALPPEARSVKRMKLLRVTAMSGEGVHRVQHPMQGGGISQAITVTLSLPPYMLVPEDVRMAYWHHESRRWLVEEDAAEATTVPAGSRELQFKTTFMTPMALVQPRTVDIPFRHWSMRPVDDVAAVVLAARATCAATGLMPPPIGPGALPRPDGGAPIGVPIVGDAATPGSRSITGAAPLGPAPIATEDVLPAGGWDEPADVASTVSGAAASRTSSACSTASTGTTTAPELLPTTRRMPLPGPETPGVLLSVETARVRLDMVVGEDAAWLVGPCRTELAHLLGVGLRPGVLLRRLRACGLRVVPETVWADYPAVTIPTGAGKRQLIVKEPVLEEESARRLARLASSVIVAPSTWNQRCPGAEFQCIVRVREASPAEMEPPSAVQGVTEKASGVEAAHAADAACHPTSWRTLVGGSDVDAPLGVRWWLAKTQEGAPSFDASPTGSVESASTCIGALQGRITAEAGNRADSASSLLVEALTCLLRRFRVLSFTQ